MIPSAMKSHPEDRRLVGMSILTFGFLILLFSILYFVNNSYSARELALAEQIGTRLEMCYRAERMLQRLQSARIWYRDDAIRLDKEAGIQEKGQDSTGGFAFRLYHLLVVIGHDMEELVSANLDRPTASDLSPIDKQLVIEIRSKYEDLRSAWSRSETDSALDYIRLDEILAPFATRLHQYRALNQKELEELRGREDSLSARKHVIISLLAGFFLVLVALIFAYVVSQLHRQLGLRRESDQMLRRSYKRIEDQLGAVTRQQALIWLLHDIASQANSSKNFLDSLRYAIHRLCQFGHWNVGHAYLLDSERNRFVSSHIWYLSDETRYRDVVRTSEEHEFQLDEVLPGKVYQQGSYVWIPDISSEDKFLRKQVCGRVGLTSVLGFPVKVKETVIGVLEFFSAERLEFDQLLTKSLGSVGVYLAYVHERAESGAHLERLVEERTRELHAAQAELIRKERLATLGQLTATVSHELRNPLGAMLPSLYTLRRRLTGFDDARVQHALDILERNTRRCDHIIDELLDFTRVRSLEMRPVALDDWLGQLLDEQKVTGNIEVIREFGLQGGEVRVDPDKLRRAVINVFENAVQAMQQLEDVSIHQLKVKTAYGVGGRVEITVEDTGPGITDEVLARIFEPLYSTKGFGVGLGMPMAKQILEQHGGGIEVATEQGKGTRMVLWLPGG